MISRLDKTIEYLLLSILVVFPFSFKQININWGFFWGIVFVLILYSVFDNKSKVNKTISTPFIMAAIYLVLLDFLDHSSSNLNSIISQKIGVFIPLTTIMFSLLFFVYTIRKVLQERIKISLSNYSQYIYSSYLFLVSMVVIFMIFIQNFYHVDLVSDVQFLSKLVKYLVLFIVIFYSAKKEDFCKKLKIGYAISILLVLLLSVLI